MRQQGMGWVGAIAAMVVAGLIVYGLIYYGPGIWQGIREGASGVGSSVPEIDMRELGINYTSDYIPTYLANNYMGQKIKLTNLVAMISQFTVGDYHVVNCSAVDLGDYIYLYGAALENRNVLFIEAVTGIVTTLEVQAYGSTENCLAIHVLEVHIVEIYKGN